MNADNELENVGPDDITGLHVKIEKSFDIMFGNTELMIKRLRHYGIIYHDRDAMRYTAILFLILCQVDQSTNLLDL